MAISRGRGGKNEQENFLQSYFTNHRSHKKKPMVECKVLQWEVSVTSSLSCLYIQYKRGTGEEEEKKHETVDKEKDKN